MTDQNDPTPPPKRRWRRILRGIGISLLWLGAAVAIIWAMLAVYFADTHQSTRPIAALLVLAAAAASAIWIPRRWKLPALATVFGTVLIWFFTLQPSNQRDWAIDCAHPPTATIDGDRVIIRNVRNFDYRSETDFSTKWDDRAYDLGDIRSTDIMLVYWGSPAIAHAMVSFGFEGGHYLCVSIETRKEKTESYSAVQGFFRQYELIHIFADERDLVRLRTNFRNEDVHVYQTTLTQQQSRDLFLSYVRRANDLAAKPQFYNALTSNCATNVIDLAREQRAFAKASINYEVLLSGYAARRAHRNGHLDSDLPFDQLEKRSRVNDAARAVTAPEHFSTAIRAVLPPRKRQ